MSMRNMVSKSIIFIHLKLPIQNQTGNIRVRELKYFVNPTVLHTTYSIIDIASPPRVNTVLINIIFEVFENVFFLNNFMRSYICHDHQVNCEVGTRHLTIIHFLAKLQNARPLLTMHQTSRLVWLVWLLCSMYALTKLIAGSYALYVYLDGSFARQWISVDFVIKFEHLKKVESVQLHVM